MIHSNRLTITTIDRIIDLMSFLSESDKDTFIDEEHRVATSI